MNEEKQRPPTDNISHMAARIAELEKEKNELITDMLTLVEEISELYKQNGRIAEMEEQIMGLEHQHWDRINQYKENITKLESELDASKKLTAKFSDEKMNLETMVLELNNDRDRYINTIQKIKNGELQRCSQCDGSCEIQIYEPGKPPHELKTIDCDFCNGTGLEGVE